MITTDRKYFNIMTSKSQNKFDKIKTMEESKDRFGFLQSLLQFSVNISNVGNILFLVCNICIFKCYS